MQFIMRNLIIFTMFSLAFSACQSNEPLPNSQKVQPSPLVTPTAPTISPSSSNANSENTAKKTNANHVIPPSPTATATPKLLVSPSITPSKYKNYTAKGVIKAIDIENSSVKIDHEDIGDYMVAMEMPFPVVNKNILKNLKVGDQVTFVLETGVGVERIVSIRKN